MQEQELLSAKFQNEEAERAILHAIIFLDSNSLNYIAEKLKPSDFFNEANRIIYSELLKLFEENKKISFLILKDVLKSKNLLDKVGGVEYLVKIQNSLTALENVEYLCDIVKDKALLRKIVRTAYRALEKAKSTENPLDVLVDLESQVIKISEESISKELTHIKDILVDTFYKLSDSFKKQKLISGIETGFIDFDRITTGLHGGELIIIAGRPGMGKTSFGLNIALNVAMNENIPVGFFSLEMSAEQLVLRLLSTLTNIEVHKLRSGFFKEEEWPKIVEGINTLSKLPLFIDDTPGLTPFDIKVRAKKQRNLTGLNLLVIDYLQLINPDRRYENRQQEIAAISRQLKSIAKDLDIPVIALSQLSREVEKRSDKRPQLSDLRESGAIEQDADLVAFLFRPEYYKIKTVKIGNEEKDSEGIAELIVAKQRNGPTGSIFLAFVKNFMTFHNLTLIEQEDYGPIPIDKDEDMFFEE